MQIRGFTSRIRAAVQAPFGRGFWQSPHLSRELREQIAERLYELLWGPLLALVLLVSVALYVTTRVTEPTRYIPGLLWLVTLLVAKWMRVRRGALAALSAITLGYVVSTTVAVLSHSVHAPAYWSNVLAAGVVVPLFGVRRGIALAIWCALCGAGWFVLQSLGYRTGVMYPTSSFAYVYLVGSMVAAIGLMSIPTALMADALKASELRRIEVVEARRAEQQAEITLQTVFEQTGAVAAIVTPNGTILQLNPAAERLLGVASSALSGRSLSALAWSSTASAEAISEAIRRGAEGIERVDAELDTDSGRRHLQLAVAPIRRPDGALESLVVEGLDVTRLLDVERDLAHAHRLEALGQLAGGVAHDFNNMLHAMQGAIDQIQLSHLMRSEQAESMETLELAVLRAAELTRKLLAFGRRDCFELQPIDLHALLREATRLFRRTLGSHVELKLELCAEDPIVEGDSAAIEHALVNLMVNARDAMKGGGTVTIRTRWGTTADVVPQKQAFAIRAGKIVVLSVIDEGCGMAEPVRSRVFEPFFTTKSVGEGSGLGLAAVHGTMLSHGGGITVESELGVGSSFHLYFPVATNTVVTRVPSSGVGFSPQLLGTVLVVDDEPLVLRVTRRYLRALGATAIFATDGVMALEMLESGEPIHCVLTDVVMPKMNGSALIAEIRKRRPGLPVVVMSGFPAGSDGLAQQVPADCPWLRKPFGQLELAKLLLPYLNGSSETEATNHET